MEAPGVNATALFALQTHVSPSGSASTTVTPRRTTPRDQPVLTIVTASQHPPPREPPRPGQPIPANRLPVAFAARQMLRSPAATSSGAWKQVVMALMAWDHRGTAADLAALPRAAFYPAHAWRSANTWEHGAGSYLAIKGGDSMATHQDLDSGNFVWECGGHRAIDLGASYTLLTCSCPSRDATAIPEGDARAQHNCVRRPGQLRHRDWRGERTDDQCVQLYTQGPPVHSEGSAARCGGGVVAVVNLSAAFARQMTRRP